MLPKANPLDALSELWRPRRARSCPPRRLAGYPDDMPLVDVCNDVDRIPHDSRFAGVLGVRSMAEHGAAEGAARPVVAGQVQVRRERPAFLTGDLAVCAVEIVNAGRYHAAFEVLPGAVADAVAGVDGAALS